MLAVLKSSRMLRAITKIAISTTMRAWMMPDFCLSEIAME